MNGLEARRNGHVFNELAEEKLYYEEHKEVCHHCGELATMEDNRCGLCGKPQWQCGNPGCGTELDEEEMIVYSLSRNGVETKWCEECFDNDGLEARRNGWVFDGDGEDILNERIEQAVYHCSHCDKTSHDEQECSECGFSGYAPELGCRDETCDVCKKGKESEFFCDVHTDLHVKHDGDGGYYCDECDEKGKCDFDMVPRRRSGCDVAGCDSLFSDYEHYSLTKDGVVLYWCNQCVQCFGQDARNDGWVFDNAANDILDDMDE
jgi:hypothetical protein